MAHMELALSQNLNVNLGDVITYVNNGSRASHGDVVKKGEGIQLNCYMLEASSIETNPDFTGEYNIPRAIVTFNKRIDPLLVVFKEEVRNGLIVDNPENRGIFTTEQCELINGHPFEEGDQDTLEEVMTLSEGEINFWERRKLSSDYMYELAEDGWNTKINFIT
jgi:hypothetical protein